VKKNTISKMKSELNMIEEKALRRRNGKNAVDNKRGLWIHFQFRVGL
jgi:hypothetical protein